MKKLSLFWMALVVWSTSMGQTLITGQVTDEAGNPLPGANVLIAETRQGTAADATGLYRIEVIKPGDYTV